jgi:signal transduction histidine kinase
MSIWSTVAFAVGAGIAFAIVYVLVADTARARSDAWLSGEAEVLAEVSGERPRDSLYNRVVEEVAELAAQEVPDERSKSGEKLNAVFFLQEGVHNEAPLWVGPGSSAPFIEAIHNAQFTPGVPQSIKVQGWKQLFRVVKRSRRDGIPIYLGLSDRSAVRLLHRLTLRFVAVWIGMAVLGYLISFESARRTLLRVERITETVAGIGSDDLSSRLPEGKHDDEISRLSRTFNHMLDRIQRSVSQLRNVTGAVAHDLKSPVTAIRGSLEVALSDGENGNWREPVAGALEGLDRLAQLLNTTLDLAEAEAGALQLRRERVDLGEAVRRHLDLYQPAMADGQYELVANLEPGVWVDVDVSLLNRTLANLLDNELTHVPAGCRIEVCVRSQDEEAQLIIQDDGPAFRAN